MTGSATKGCGSVEVGIFLCALIAGTCCSLSSKVLLSMRAVGTSGKMENFEFPLFQTFGMFLGMLVALFLHFAVVVLKIPFPGYDHSIPKNEVKSIPLWMYFLLAIPSTFDLMATALCTYGLLYVNVSIYQMLRGSAIVFVAILKQFMLGHKLYKFQWIGVFWNVVSIVLVGYTALQSGSTSSEAVPSNNTPDTLANPSLLEASNKNPMVGVILILLGAFVQSLQYAFEEKVMTMEIPAPPMLLIGMEGLWGTVLCLFILYPIAYATHGEDPYNTYVMIKNSVAIQWTFFLYFSSIFMYNVFGVLVTYTLNSVWHAILDNFRPMTVWGVDLFIFYSITRSFGESWSYGSYIQLIGMFVLLYGTAIYNAPNAGSIKLEGGAQSLFMDFTDEYTQIEEELELLDLDMKSSEISTPYIHNMSPFLASPMIPQAYQRSNSLRKSYGTAGGGYNQVTVDNRSSF